MHLELLDQSQRMLGYPLNCRNTLDLTKLTRFVINNLGDPFQSPRYGLNTFNTEREVLDTFAKLFGMSSHWGYFASGGTEANLAALWGARERFPDGKVYCSQETHHSVRKACHLLGVECLTLPTDERGELDYYGLTRITDDKPAIVVANYGTTMRGAIDSVERIKEALGSRPHYLHVDAALFGGMLPFVEGAPSVRDFDSIAISGHKFLGSPIPCGILLCRERPVRPTIEYIGATDTTLSGSRSGLAVLCVSQLLKVDQRPIAERCLELASYATKELARWHAWRNPFSNIVVFDKPSERLCNRWQLACERTIAHICVMPHVTENMIDKFVVELGDENHR